jgi:hypothetical protein
MPLNTQVIRNGERLGLPWGDFHVAAMALASCFDAGGTFLSDPDDVYDELHNFKACPDGIFPITRMIAFNVCNYPVLAKTPLNEGVYTLKNRYRFWDTSDGEIFELLPGDELHAVRSGW